MVKKRWASVRTFLKPILNHQYIPQTLRAKKWSLYLPTCAETSADSTLVVAELTSVPSTFLLALEQVLTLSWWWQSSEVFLVPSYLCWNKCWLYPGCGRAQKYSLYLPTCAETSADSTLVVAELKSGPCIFPFGLEQVPTIPWWWQNSEVVIVPSYLPWLTNWLTNSLTH